MVSLDNCAIFVMFILGKWLLMNSQAFSYLVNKCLTSPGDETMSLYTSEGTFGTKSFKGDKTRV